MWPFRKSSPYQPTPTLPDSPLGHELQRIRDGLTALQRVGPSRQVFGSEAHGFALNAPVSETEVAAFENEHRIRLPDDYRSFLVYLGNGGAGPTYGLFKLGEMDDGDSHKPWREDNGFVGILSQPLPHTQAWNDLTGKPPFDESREDDQEYEDEYWEKVDRWDQEHYWNTRFINGAIPICHTGCARRQWLVVTGPEAGNIWCDDRVDEQGFYPLQIDTVPRVTFLDWYRTWLDDALLTLAAGG